MTLQEQQKVELKMFYQAQTARESPNPRQRRNGAVRCCCTLLAASAYHSYAAGVTGMLSEFSSMVTLTYDL